MSNTTHTDSDITTILREINRIAEENYNNGFKSGVEECIKIAEQCVWKDADMLVGMFKEWLKER